MACKHYCFNLTKEHRHFIDNWDAAEYNNCLLCIIDNKGSMTQEEVGKYMGLTKMRISQIERQSIKNMRKVAKKIFSNNPLHK